MLFYDLHVCITHEHVHSHVHAHNGSIREPCRVPGDHRSLWEGNHSSTCVFRGFVVVPWGRSGSRRWQRFPRTAEQSTPLGSKNHGGACLTSCCCSERKLKNERRGCKGVQALCKNSLAFPQTVNMEFQQSQENSFLKHSNMNVNRISFLTVEKRKSQPDTPAATGGCSGKRWCSRTMRYYLAIKRDKVQIHVTTWINGKKHHVKKKKILFQRPQII